MEVSESTFNSDDVETNIQDMELANKYVKRKGRGPTTMPHLIRVRESGAKLVVQYNDKGQPTGREAIQMTSYLGALVRTVIPITYTSWRVVPNEFKENIISSLQMVFEIQPSCSKRLLNTAGIQWRQFKSKLTRKYILPFCDQPNILKSPPAQYDHIKQQDWDAFVRARLSEKFAELSQQQKERRAKNVYNHSVSRIGYTDLEVKLPKNKHKSKMLPYAELCNITSSNKRGDHLSSMAKECVDKIVGSVLDDLSKKSEEGSLMTPNGRDIPPLVLDVPKHADRAKGVEELMTRPSYFHPMRIVQKDDKRDNLFEQQRVIIEAQQKQLKETMAAIAKLEANIEALSRGRNRGTSLSETASCSTMKNIEGGDTTMKGKACDLLLGGDLSNVGVGTILQRSGDHFRVCLDVAFDYNVALPVPPNEGIVLLGEAVGQVVNWPVELVRLIKPGNKKEPIVKVKKSEAIKVMKNECSVPMPGLVRLLYKTAEKGMSSTDTVMVPLQYEILGKERKIYCTQNDISLISTMSEISNTCITLYMGVLYNMLHESSPEELFSFVEASHISYAVGNADRLSYLSSRMENAVSNQLFLTPFNAGNHWVLIVLNPTGKVVYWFDPLQHAPHNEIKKIIDMSLRTLKTKNKKTRIAWKVMKKCPRQSQSVESGYYVMRYMRDIIVHGSIMSTFSENSNYTQADIDEVRVEWASYVAEYI